MQMAIDLTQFQNLGLPEIVLWLLSFAIVYGILDQAKTPQSKASRGVISVVIAFFVLLSAPSALITFLSNMTSSLVLVLVGLLVLIVFLEVAGLKVSGERIYYDEKGKAVHKEGESTTIFVKYGYIFAIAFIIIAALIFVNAGGLQTLGININLSGAATTTTAFFIFIILAVLWMVAEKK